MEGQTDNVRFGANPTKVRKEGDTGNRNQKFQMYN